MKKLFMAVMLFVASTWAAIAQTPGDGVAQLVMSPTSKTGFPETACAFYNDTKVFKDEHNQYGSSSTSSTSNHATFGMVTTGPVVSIMFGQLSASAQAQRFGVLPFMDSTRTGEGEARIEGRFVGNWKAVSRLALGHSYSTYNPVFTNRTALVQRNDYTFPEGIRTIKWRVYMVRQSSLSMQAYKGYSSLTAPIAGVEWSGSASANAASLFESESVADPGNPSTYTSDWGPVISNYNTLGSSDSTVLTFDLMVKRIPHVAPNNYYQYELPEGTTASTHFFAKAGAQVELTTTYREPYTESTPLAQVVDEFVDVIASGGGGGVIIPDPLPTVYPGAEAFGHGKGLFTAFVVIPIEFNNGGLYIRTALSDEEAGTSNDATTNVLVTDSSSNVLYSGPATEGVPIDTGETTGVITLVFSRDDYGSQTRTVDMGTETDVLEVPLVTLYRREIL